MWKINKQNKIFHYRLTLKKQFCGSLNQINAKNKLIFSGHLQSVPQRLVELSGV